MICRYDSPLGPLTLVLDADGSIERLTWGESVQNPQEADANSKSLFKVLDAYFEGKPLENPLALNLNGTPFQLSVWHELSLIPYGQTRSYSEIARRIGRPKAVRAVANACHLNPISIIIPCHRVIGADGSLTGYAAGLDIKRRLLALERPKLF